jgi:hypothetical protein
MTEHEHDEQPPEDGEPRETKPEPESTVPEGIRGAKGDMDSAMMRDVSHKAARRRTTSIFRNPFRKPSGR